MANYILWKEEEEEEREVGSDSSATRIIPLFSMMQMRNRESMNTYLFGLIRKNSESLRTSLEAGKREKNNVFMSEEKCKSIAWQIEANKRLREGDKLEYVSTNCLCNTHCKSIHVKPKEATFG